jgi:uncharacterized lipoprotein NlpE involved in copper resistance
MKKTNWPFVKIFIYFLFSFMIFFAGCSPKHKANPSVPTGDNSMVSLDWDGLYMGTLPCADCEGIETWLTLSKDKSYLLKTKYIGKGDASEQFGKFSWNTAGSTITLAGIKNAPNQYLVGEGRLFQLDMDGKRITGNLAEKYELKKIQ